MQLFLSFLLAISFISLPDSATDVQDEPVVVIEVMNADDIPFDFSMTYDERRKIIKIRSAQPIKSLRTVESATNSHKGYNVLGSDLIILPQHDFQPGSYIAEIKFQDNATVVLANMHIVESPVADGQ